jgi:hypothetical protein
VINGGGIGSWPSRTDLVEGAAAVCADPEVAAAAERPPAPSLVSTSAPAPTAHVSARAEAITGHCRLSAIGARPGMY